MIDVLISVVSRGDSCEIRYFSWTDELMNTAVANEKAIDSLKALAEPNRLKIIESLSNVGKCFCDLMQEIGLGQL